jgi:hypothetical protein
MRKANLYGPLKPLRAWKAQFSRRGKVPNLFLFQLCFLSSKNLPGHGRFRTYIPLLSESISIPEERVRAHIEDILTSSIVSPCGTQ